MGLYKGERKLKRSSSPAPERSKAISSSRPFVCDESGSCSIITHSQGVLDDSRGVALRFDTSKWLFTQATIIYSVKLEENPPYYLSPLSEQFVNSQNIAISNEKLKQYYQTFIGSHNFVNHRQNPQESRGFIVDAYLREIHPYPERPDFYVYYCDILVATNCEADPQLCQLIRDGVIRFMSKGVLFSASQCSKCGRYAFSETEKCVHLELLLGEYFIDERGIKRKIVRLVTDYPPNTGSIKFNEASFITSDPAYSGAVVSHIIPISREEVIIPTPYFILERDGFLRWANEVEVIPRAMQALSSLESCEQKIVQEIKERGVVINKVHLIMGGGWREEDLYRATSPPDEKMVMYFLRRYIEILCNTSSTSALKIFSSLPKETKKEFFSLVKDAVINWEGRF